MPFSSTATRSPFPSVKQEVDVILRRMGVSGPPVQPRRVVDLWPNLAIIEEDLDGDGYLLPIGDIGAEILVNRSASAERRAYTIAHEIGHWVLGLALKKETGSFSQPKNVPRYTVEKWCDLFAATFLMPAEFIAQYLPSRRQPFLIEAVLRGPTRFMVSKEAFFLRLWEVESIQVLVIQFEPFLKLIRNFGGRDLDEQCVAALKEARIDEQLRMGQSVVFSPARSGSDSIWISGKRTDGHRATVTIAWPEGLGRTGTD